MASPTTEDMASPKTEEAEFWESLENMFGRKIPINSQVRYVINMAIKESRNQDPEEREKVINAAVYLAHDIVTSAFRDKSEAKVAFTAMKIAEDFIVKELKAKGITVPSESKTETKQTTERKKTAGDFMEQFPGIKKLERKGGPREKRKEENVDYVVIEDVVNIYLNIIKKFVEANKENIFKGKNYQTLKNEEMYDLHVVSGLPTFLNLKHRPWIRITHNLENNIERFKVSLPSSATHRRKFNEAFSNARDELFSEAIDSMLCAFKKFMSAKHVEGTVFIERVRNQLLEDTNFELERKIKNIIDPDTEMSLGKFVDSQALKLWEENGGNMKELNDFVEEVKEMFKKLPEFVVFWGEWAYVVSKNLKPEASPVK